MSGNPTHVVVAVQRAKDLISKGKNGTNDAFVTIALLDKKFQTTIKDKVIDPEWYEECDVPLPENYNDHKLTLQVFHRNNLGIDEFLGHLEVPLQNFDVYDPPKSIWYSLLCKPGQNKTKPRGELEVRMSFEVKKVKDFDAMSTASAASRRFKMSKKSVKHAASAIGRKIKGPKPEKTSDYVHVPDLTGLDAGALGMDDIAENYASPVVNVSKKRLSATSDSLSLPPSSPAFQRSSPRSSRGYSPFNARRRSRGEHDTPPSSNASTEDVKQKAEDADSTEGLFSKTHRRGGSGSEVLQIKPNRRLLTTRPKSSSTVDISSAVSGELEGTTERAGFGADESTVKSRLRSATSASQLSAGTLPDVEEDSKEGKSFSSQQIVAGAPAKDEPELVDDDSDDSLAGYSPSPIAPIFRKEEPTDLFTRLDAQMKQEQEDDFSLVKHQAEPGEKVFGSVGTFIEPDDTAAHSTPIAAEPVITTNAKQKKKEKKEKVLTPPSDLFNLLMASDEPEYDVDATLPPNSKLVPLEEANPFEEETSESEDVAEDKDADPRSDDKVELLSESLPVIVDSPAENIPEKNASGEQSEPLVLREESLPLPDHESKDSNTDKEALDHAAELRSSPKPEEYEKDVSTAAVGSNPFEDEPVVVNTSQNPFEDASAAVDSKTTGGNNSPSDDSTLNPFGANDAGDASGNPFEVEGSPETASQNPFKAADAKPSAAANPFESANNPFEEDDDETSSFNRVGSFARKGSSRFADSKPRRKRELKKTAAPPPPKPQRVFVDADKQESAVSPNESPVNMTKRLSKGTTESPKHKFKKDKKAPDAPVHLGLSSTESPRRRTGSFEPVSSPSNLAAGERRRDTDIGRMEAVIRDDVKVGSSGSPHLRDKCERQPAVGAEAPDVPVEPRVTYEIGVQTEDSSLPAEFSNKSTKELVEIIKKLRAQVRKGEDHAKDLEDYIDSLLLRVMTTDPNLLVTQASCSKQAHHAGRI